MSTAREQIAAALNEVNIVLGNEELGGHDRIVKYRSKTLTTPDPDAGVKGTNNNTWTTMAPKPKAVDITHKFIVVDVGIIQINDVKLTINRSLFTMAQLQSYEYDINGAIFDLVNGHIIQEPYNYILYVRKKGV